MKDEKQSSESHPDQMGFQRILALATCVCEHYLGPDRDQSAGKAQLTRAKTKRVRTRENKG